MAETTTSIEEDSTSASSVATKSEQDLFDETIDSNNEANVYTDTDGELKKASHVLTDLPSDSTPTNQKAAGKPTNAALSSSSNRRINLMKRRYKSGIPLNNMRNDEDDSVEETYLKQFNESINRKQSKDDSSLIYLFFKSLFEIFESIHFLCRH